MDGRVDGWILWWTHRPTDRPTDLDPTPLIDQLPDPNATQILYEVRSLSFLPSPTATVDLVARVLVPGRGFAVGVFYVSQSNLPPPAIKFVFIMPVLQALGDDGEGFQRTGSFLELDLAASRLRAPTGRYYTK